MNVIRTTLYVCLRLSERAPAFLDVPRVSGKRLLTASHGVVRPPPVPVATDTIVSGAQSRGRRNAGRDECRGSHRPRAGVADDCGGCPALPGVRSHDQPLGSKRRDPLQARRAFWPMRPYPPLRHRGGTRSLGLCGLAPDKRQGPSIPVDEPQGRYRDPTHRTGIQVWAFRERRARMTRRQGKASRPRQSRPPLPLVSITWCRPLSPKGTHQ